MAYVDDVTIPDNAPVAPGSKFVKTWKVRNNGQCTWGTNYRLIYGWAANWPEIVAAPPTSVAITKSVEPGAEYDVSVTLTAPVKSGVYMAAFRLQNDKGFNFGTILFIQFQVNGTATP
jgi:next-to-BRCA1 protein 1